MADFPLVVIDENGRVRADGRAAERRLAGRAGRFRLVSTTPSLVVLAREEEGVIDRLGSPRIALSGEVDAAGGLSDIIAFLHQSQWSGSLHAMEGPSQRTVWFKRGDVRTCGSNLPADRLGELLYRFGRINREDLERALLRVGPDRRIGQALIELGVVSSHDIFSFIRKQVEEVFFAMLLMRHGTFYFERTDGEEKLPDLALSTQNLLLEGVRRMDEINYFREKIPSLEVVPEKRSGAPTLPPAEEHARLVLELVDGLRSVDAIARASRLGEFDATRALFQLAAGGWIEIKSEWELVHTGLRRPQSPERGGLERLIEVFNELLAKIHATLADSGKAERFRADLGAFFRGATAYSELFEDVVPGADGRLPSAELLENLDHAQVSDRAQYLHQALNELLFFLVFTVGEVIGRREEQDLSRRLNEILRDLATSGSAPSAA